MKVLSLLSILSAVLILGSCQKDDSTDSIPKSKTELITLKAWKYNDAKIDTDNNGTGDQAIPAGVIESCQSDNNITFATSGTGTVDEGPTKCDAADPQSSPFTWSFTSNETMISFSSPLFSGFGGDFKIISLTESELVISQLVSVLPPPLPSVTIIASFKH